MIHSQVCGEKTGSQGHFAIKGFSDLTVHSHTTLWTGASMQLLAKLIKYLAFRLNAVITFMFFYPSNLMWHKPLSQQLEHKTAFNKWFETGMMSKMQDLHYPKWLWIVKQKCEKGSYRFKCKDLDMGHRGRKHLPHFDCQLHVAADFGIDVPHTNTIHDRQLLNTNLHFLWRQLQDHLSLPKPCRFHPAFLSSLKSEVTTNFWSHFKVLTFIRKHRSNLCSYWETFKQNFLSVFLPFLDNVLVFRHSSSAPFICGTLSIGCHLGIPPASFLAGFTCVSVSLSVPTSSVGVVTLVLIRARAFLLWGARVFGAGIWDHAVWTINL